MPDKKLTDAEIKKALECCRYDDYDYCEKCPYSKNKPCQENLIQDAFDLINRLQAENERLEKEKQLLLDNHPSHTHRNCVVINNGLIYTKTIEDYEKWLTDVSTEAYKEFAERLCEDRLANDSVVISAKCPLKELTDEPPPNDVKCIDCEYLEFDVPYGVCSMAYKGIVHPNDCCGKGKLKGDDNER